MLSMPECLYSTAASMSCCTLATCWSVYLSGRWLHVGRKIWLYDVACCSVCLAAGMPPVAGHVLAAISGCLYASCCPGYSAIIWPAVGCYIWLYACHPLLSISGFTLAICWLLCLTIRLPPIGQVIRLYIYHLLAPIYGCTYVRPPVAHNRDIWL